VYHDKYPSQNIPIRARWSEVGVVTKVRLKVSFPPFPYIVS
jgi:hypothetical protein